MCNNPQMDKSEGGCLMGNCPNTPDPFVTKATEHVERRKYSLRCSTGGRVGEKESPLMLHME